MDRHTTKRDSFSDAGQLVGHDSPTDDDVSITRDGRRLDTADKVIAFLDQISVERAAASRRD